MQKLFTNFLTVTLFHSFEAVNTWGIIPLLQPRASELFHQKNDFPLLNEGINHNIYRNKGVQRETVQSICSQVKDHQHLNSFISAKDDRS